MKTATTQAVDILKQYILAEGFPFTVDLEKSRGCYVHDATNGRDLLDFFTFFATAPLGHNHPKVAGDEAFKKDLLQAALSNPSNSDFYTRQYAAFVETFARVAMPEAFRYAFFISGGAMAVENAIKVAMDWKVQKNFGKGHTSEKGHQVIHFKDAFHGRSGYTLSMTNTDPTKTNYFFKFPWPRVSNPGITFPLGGVNLEKVIAAEKKSVQEIRKAFADHPGDICAIIIEPIQSEGGDIHFRKEFLQSLRDLADENEALLIFDEVQTGVAHTGKFWCYEHFGVVPDILVFGKKMQICGIISTTRVDEVENNCFHVKSRINSTWGGSLADMVRAGKYLEVIEQDKLTENALAQGAYLLDRLLALKGKHPVSNVRGRGLQCAFDLPDKEMRNKMVGKALENNLLLLACGERSIRFRPPLIITEKEINEGMERMEKSLKAI